MAENESLDIENRNSRRWRILREAIRAGADDDVVVRALLENLVQTLKKVVRQAPLAPLLQAMLNGGDVLAILRGCRNHEYAMMIANQFEPGLDAAAIVEHAIWFTVDRFLDQIALGTHAHPGVVPSEHWPDVVTYDLAQGAWRAAIYDDVRHLARTLADNPTRGPRLPSRTTEEKAHDLADLNSLSLLERPGGSHA
jgi:AcrR family transcriptional regulator